MHGVIMKTTFKVSEEDQFIVLLNGGFSINPQNIVKMESIKEKIEQYLKNDDKKINTKKISKKTN